MAAYALTRFTSPNAGVSVNQAGTDQYIAAAYGQAIKNLDVNAANITGGNAWTGAQTGMSLTSPTMTSPTISSGNLTFSTTTQRITGDMSNATLGNRLAFQTSTVDGNTTLTAVPNGAGVASILLLSGAADSANAPLVVLTGSANPALNVTKTGSGTAPTNLLFQFSAAQTVTFQGSIAAANAAAIQVTRTDTITGGVTDGLTAALSLAPTYSAASALTVTRHNYLYLLNPVLSGAGPAALTDACAMYFDAAAGTHKAVDSGTTKTSPGTVTQWIKVNVNGTIAYIPSYSSKTS